MLVYVVAGGSEKAVWRLVGGEFRFMGEPGLFFKKGSMSLLYLLATYPSYVVSLRLLHRLSFRNTCSLHPMPFTWICILSKTLSITFFALPPQPSHTSVPTKAPCVLSNLWGLRTLHISCISSGESGIMLGMDHMKA
jgi:hypothetical protein